MEITFNNKTLNGKVCAKPLYEDLKRYLICSLFSNETSIIRNVLLDKETKAFLNMLNKLGMVITIEEFEGKRKTLKVKGSYPFNVNLENLDTKGNIYLLKTFAPLLLVSKKKFSIKYNDILISNSINSNYDLFFKKGFSKIQREKNEFPIKIKSNINNSTFYIRGDVEKEYLSTMFILISKAFKNAKIVILGPALKDLEYIKRTIEILREFNINIKIKDFREFEFLNSKFMPCNTTIENDYTTAAVWITASALGHKVMAKNLYLNSRQKNKKLLDILKIIGFNILVNKHGDIIAKPNKIHSFNVDISKIPDLLPYLAVIASVAEGTSKLKHAAEIYINNNQIAIDISNALNEIGADTFVFGGDLIIRGREMLKGGSVKSTIPHEVIFALCSISRQCINPIKIDVPKTTPRYYREFYRDLNRLRGGKLF